MKRKQFEYHCESYSMAQPCRNKKGDVKGGSVAIKDWRLEELGKEGWEMCGVRYDGTWTEYYFKREVNIVN